MFKFLSWALFIPFALVVVTFAVSNRIDITVAFWPLPFTLDMPLYSLSLGTLAFGFFFGALLTWLSVAKWRVIAASRKKDFDFSQMENDRLRAEIDALKSPETTQDTTLPPAMPTSPAMMAEPPSPAARSQTGS